MKLTKRNRKHRKRRTLKRLRYVGGNSNKIYISGEAFKNICKYNLDDRYNLIPIDSNLKENDYVFLKQGDINKIIDTSPSKKLIL